MQYQVLLRKQSNLIKAIESLEVEVAKAIELGWVPQGGVSCFMETEISTSISVGHYVVCQAITKP